MAQPSDSSGRIAAADAGHHCVLSMRKSFHCGRRADVGPELADLVQTVVIQDAKLPPADEGGISNIIVCLDEP